MTVGAETDSQAIDEIVCACIDMRKSDLAAVLAASPALTFDDLMKMTGAGGKCTACLLDLKYYYTTMPRAAAPQAYLEKSKVSARSLKQRLYDFLDRLSPAMPMTLMEWLPVPVAQGVAVSIWLANRPLPGKSDICAPPLDVELTVRDANGEIRHHGRHSVQPDADLRIEVSRFLASNVRPCNATVGSVQIQRHFHRSGVRGTTRPQIEIVGPEGSSTVHSQRPTARGRGGFTHLCRPLDERLFLSIVNPGSRELHGTVRSHLADDPAIQVLPARSISIPPSGAGLLELSLPDTQEFRDRICSLEWEVDGISSVHLLCAPRSLGAFSIDHI